MFSARRYDRPACADVIADGITLPAQVKRPVRFGPQGEVAATVKPGAVAREYGLLVVEVIKGKDRANRCAVQIVVRVVRDFDVVVETAQRDAVNTVIGGAVLQDGIIVDGCIVIQRIRRIVEVPETDRRSRRTAWAGYARFVIVGNVDDVVTAATINQIITCTCIDRVRCTIAVVFFGCEELNVVNPRTIVVVWPRSFERQTIVA